MAMTSVTQDEMRVPLPTWIAASLELNEGRDPLGLQTTTQDRLMPLLLPGILELTRRARYFSFHAFLLSEYRNRHMPADSKSLSAFIKHREWEFGLAVLRCPRKCESSPVGARRLGRLEVLGSGPFPRGESVESSLGGYGLYYRTPLAELGLVARAGTLLGGEPIPIDVLRDTERAQRLANTFREAVHHTAYYQRALQMADDLSAEVIDEYAEAACLCQLRDRPDERAAVHDALFGNDPPDAAGVGVESTEQSRSSDAPQVPVSGLSQAGVIQRRRSVGHYLTLLASEANVVASESAYREVLWLPPTSPRSDAHALVAGQWSALIAKDVWQEAICSVWSEFCRDGLALTRELSRGLTWEETREFVAGMTGGPPVLDPEAPTAALAARLADGTLAIDDGEAQVDVATAPLEDLRELTSRLNTATSGVVVLLELTRRMEQRSGVGWEQATRIASGWQPSIASVAVGLRTHLQSNPTVQDTLWWLVSRFVLPVHERIAYSKLPEFTFRFRWEDGLLRFYDLGTGRFPLAAIRDQPLALLTWDLGLWNETGDDAQPATLTDRGADFVQEVLV
jgi:hypothetical protein